ncbi:iron uptake system protein EfeO [Paracoccus sp. YIM 132242]|uniref:Iron uptake system protein EfeO n=1 Tax=Paracoccus lichenicola TaxID=2665644 RepID=A0A6L6HR20_9RHOB|nr:iron uptake system protein EfeO [Paracoccus lichenicola]MTE00792.1 iron uptake system protein EfeO [Paracoccus lichenicola]
MTDTHPPRTGLGLAVAAAAMLVVAGGGAFWYATQRNAAANPEAPADMTVSVGAETCDPRDITVPGGNRSFRIVNASDRPIEWEILDGVMVVAERENIAPGFRQTLTVQLAPGDYAITCGLLSNPRGTLHVTPSDEAAVAASEVTLRKFLGPLSEYRVYLVLQSAKAVKAAEALREAIAAGDLAAAQAAWKAARIPYRQIEPLASRMADLENAIDPNAVYLAGQEGDPGFTGYHRLEYGLFGQNSTDGLAPVADRLVADLTDLSARLKAVEIDPALLIGLPGAMAGQLATAHVPAGENRYAGNDLDELQASLDGIGKLTGLLRPVLAGVDPGLEGDIGAAQDKAERDLASLKQGDAWPAYDQVTDDRRQQLAGSLTALQTALDRMQPVIGIN